MDPRKAMFAACKSLGMDEGDRRAMLYAITGPNSSTDLTPAQWRAVLTHLNSKTGRPSMPNEWAWVDNAPADRQPQLRKLIMLAKAAGIARGGQIAYLEGIAKQAGGLGARKIAKPLRMCDASELRVIVQALSVYIRRHAKAGERPDRFQKPVRSEDVAA